MAFEWRTFFDLAHNIQMWARGVPDLEAILGTRKMERSGRGSNDMAMSFRLRPVLRILNDILYLAIHPTIGYIQQVTRIAHLRLLAPEHRRANPYNDPVLRALGPNRIARVSSNSGDA
jgi:hypothetical protein